MIYNLNYIYIIFYFLLYYNNISINFLLFYILIIKSNNLKYKPIINN